MSKKQSTLLAAVETTTAPANSDFVVDAKFARLSLQVFDITGTTPTIAVTATALIDKGFTLAYDAQTANFTPGRTVVGAYSNARGVLMDDTDAGTTGTLELKKVVGNFIDNEPLQEEISGVETSGAAVANGTLTRVLIESGVWATIGAGAVDADAYFINPDVAANEDSRYHILPRRFRLKVTEGGTWTAAKFAVDIMTDDIV